MVKDYDKQDNNLDNLLVTCLDLGTLVRIRRDLELSIEVDEVIKSLFGILGVKPDLKEYDNSLNGVNKEISNKIRKLSDEKLSEMLDIFNKRLRILLGEDIEDASKNGTYNLLKNGDERKELKIKYYDLYKDLLNKERSRRLLENLDVLDKESIEQKINACVNDRYGN